MIARIKQTPPQVWLKIILAFFSVLFLSTVIGNHYLFKTYAFDYANYNFAFRDCAHFRSSKNFIYLIWGGNYGFLQDHFSFTLFYFIPFYWLLNWLTGSYTLLILQTALIVTSGWAVYLFVHKRTANQWLSLFALLQYFTLQGRFSAFTSDVNIGIISACFVPFYLYFFEQKKYLWSTFIFVLALFSRENMALWFIFIAIVQMYWYRKDAKAIKLCVFYLLASIVFFVLLFKVFIPLVENDGKKYSLFEFSILGETPIEAIFFILKHPIKTIQLLFVNHTGNAAYDYLKAEFYILYFLSGGVLLFCRPIYFIWFLPAIALKMFNDGPVRWSIEWYYAIDVVTLLPISIALIVDEFKNAIMQKIIIFGVIILTVVITIYESTRSHRVLGWWGTDKESILSPEFFTSPNGIHARKTNQYLKLIPANTSVSASEKLLPHLSLRDSIYFFPFIGKANYLAFLNNTRDNYLSTDSDYFNAVKNYSNNPEWTVLVNDSPLVILKRK